MSANLGLDRVTEPQMVALAREVAMDVLPLDNLLRKLGISLIAFEAVQRHPRFAALVEQFSVEWASTLNTPERVKIKAQALVEDVLPEFHSLIHDRKESFAAKVEALKALRALGGMADRAEFSGPQERFKLEIHIGDGKPNIINVTPAPAGNFLTSGVNDLELAGGLE